MQRFLRVLGFLLATGFTLFVVAVVVVVAAYLYVAPDHPDVEVLREVEMKVPMRVYSRDGRLMAEFGEERRRPLAYEEFPERLREAFIAAEDDRFYQHPGVDYQGLIRATINLIRTRERTQGGSTITMQVARNFFLTRDRTYIRKISEIFLALKIERELSKEEILSLYLNKIFLGHRAFGVAAAAEVYYGKTVDELSLAEMAMIAGLPQAPSRANPLSNPERAVQRRGYVLGRMLERGIISQEEYAEAVMAPVTASHHGAVVEASAPFVSEMVRQHMLDAYGEDAYTEGFRVYTTIDPERQDAATAALRRGLMAYDRRHGWRGAVGQVAMPENPDDDRAWASTLASYYRIGGLEPVVVAAVDEAHFEAVNRMGERLTVDFDTMEWARPFINRARVGDPPEKPADVVMMGDVVFLQNQGDRWGLAQVPEVEGTVVALDPQDGAIIALAGGFDFRHSQFNRAVQALRQPGSAFKPFIYSAALENGFTAATLINDAPVVFEDAALEDVWRPTNYTGRFFGPTRLREALVHSRNLVSVRVLRDVGVWPTVRHLEPFGFEDHSLPRDLSLALGSGDLTPLQLTQGYAVFANGGYRVDPWFIERIEDRHGEAVFTAQPATVCPECEQPELANGYLTDITAPNDENDAVTTAWHPDLFDDELSPSQPLRPAERVINPQNAYLMDSMLRDVIRHGTGRHAMRTLGRRDLAGKTGTANEYRDAWFSGYNPDLVATAWIGFDRSQSLGPREGGAGAALPIWTDFMGQALSGMPERTLEQPAGMVSVRISRESGLVVGADHPNGMFELFREGELPEREERSDQEDSAADDLF
ncbi:penicillin-binding protein 1A [Natronospira bacteriovora]|uniref:Penicillin-binding protein 1A n=1 Tax=Natronospira bacteriovora TaxID=3069753 RepID=A0ABU0W844_9GAMM|nr:penicillin-binding protein 1A [Natronospira sp. AB-CW4]MDQ2070211.1 penicillin-binding protein 1A [Natronospira sp. AB-CW4]